MVESAIAGVVSLPEVTKGATYWPQIQISMARAYPPRPCIPILVTEPAEEWLTMNLLSHLRLRIDWDED